MIAGKNTLKYSRRLTVLSFLLCVSHPQAQQDQPQQQQPQQQQQEQEDQRVERLGEAGVDEWEMDLSLPKAAPAESQDKHDFALPDAEQSAKLQQLLSQLAANPGDKNVLAQLNQLLSEVLDHANALMDAGAIGEVEPFFALIQSVDPGLAGFSAAKERLASLQATDELIRAGDAALASGQVLEPADDSAFYFFSRALERDPQSAAARQGLESVQQNLIGQALEYARGFDFETAENWLLQASEVSSDQQPVEAARLEVAEFKQAHAAGLQQQVFDAINAGNYDLADSGIIDLMALGGHQQEVKALLARLQEARVYGGFEPGQIITDTLHSGGKTPAVVIIDAGTFLMGSKGRSADSKNHEEPQHRVVIKRGFGLGVTEVTVAEFQLFIERSGYQTAAEINGSSNIYDEATGRLSKRAGVYWKHDYRGKTAEPGLPVLHVNVNDAEAYLRWLILETGKSYRLPSEAEYEYVAKAGGNGPFWWGEDAPAAVVENLTGERDKLPSKRQWSSFFKKYGDGYWGPAPAGSLVSTKLRHPMGVRDIAGNVSEWMADCWHDNYVKAPTDGSAWHNPGCDRRVVRGGYWASAPEQGRAAFRFSVKAVSYGPVVGFRIARDL